MARPLGRLTLVLAVVLSVLLAGLARAAPQDSPELSTLPPLPPVVEEALPPTLEDYETNVSSEESSEEEISSGVAEADEALAVAASIVRRRLNRTEQLTESVPEAPEEVAVIPPEPASAPITLVLKETDAEDFAITFAEEESYVKVDLQGVTLCPDYQLKLQFRSDLPNGLLTFLRQVPATVGSAPRIHQYLYLKKGRLSVRSVVEGQRQNFVSQRGGLQDRDWHTVSLTVSCTKGSIVLAVDGMEEVFPEPRLETFAASDGTGKSLARLWVGGLPLAASEVERPLLDIKRFRGCMRNVQLLQTPMGGSSSEEEETSIEPIPVPLNVVGQQGVVSRITCVNKCLETNACSKGSVCINHFSHSTCDCSQLQTLGAKCEKKDSDVLRLTGDGYLEHKLYTWQDRAQRRQHRLTFHFKTNTSDTVLFFARSLHPSRQYVTIALDAKGRLRVSCTFDNFEENVAIKVDGIPFFLNNATTDGTTSLADNDWHHVIVNYASEEATAVDLDPDVYFGYAPDFNQACKQPRIAGDLQCRKEATDQPGTKYYFDPSQAACFQMEYSGCGGNQNRFASEDDCLKTCYVPGLVSYKPFMGSLRKVFVDSTNLLEELRTKGRSTRYTGSQPEESQGAIVGQVLSFATQRSSAPLPSSITEPQQGVNFELEFRVKGAGNASQGVLAQGAVVMADTVDRWMVYSDGNHLFFRLQNDLINVAPATKIISNDWNKVAVRALDSTVTLILNGVEKTEIISIPLQYVSGVTLGGNQAAFRGCVRNVKLDGGPALDLRQFISSDRGVVFDGCKVQGPCEVSGCLHGGVCSLTASNEVKCDCSTTGYEGNRCQFALYPSSCEGYRRHGFSSPGLYRVDLDGDGPNPNIVVQCNFDDSGTTTEIQHNVPQEFIVRRKGYHNHRVDVNYEGLSKDQLVGIVSQSTSCYQNVSFDCTRARLKLSSETWFSSPTMRLNSFFGTDVPGICPCRAAEQCDKPNVPCNCDINDGVKRRDSAIIREKRQLPVTGLFFVMDAETTVKNTKATLSLGPLVCYKKTSPEDSVSLLDSESFLEFSSSSSPGRLASVGFAFRTSATQATILHKPSFHPVQADYRLLLTSSNTLEFEYRHQDVFLSATFHTTYQLSVKAWQYVWLDLSDQEIRVVLNGHTKFISLYKDEVIEGDFYLGGTPSDLQGSMFQPPTLPGLIGCLKDLTVNKDPLSLRQILKKSPTQQFNLGCQLSCDPSPCYNDATCIENPLGKYECKCRNLYAESGKNCEKNLNSNSVTLLNGDTEMRFANERNVQNISNPLKEDVTFSFRTRELQGQLVFVKDHVQNLLQIYLSKPNEVTVMWNTGNQLQKMAINTENVELNQGYPVQLHLTRSRRGMELYLLTRGQSFHALQEVALELLEESQYQQFPFGSEIPDPELTLYEKPSNLPRPYLKVRIGAALSGGVRGKVPGIVGCISGLKVGARQLDLQDRTIWTWNQNTFELGCYSACSAGQQCLNGGLCMDVFHRGNDLTKQCDCTSTSYRGERCSEEIAYSFSGDDALVFKTHYGVFASLFTADFAFAVADQKLDELINEEETQTLMILRDIPARPELYAELAGPGDLLAVGLHGSSELVIVARISILDSHNLRTLKVNLTDVNISDGFRYHVVVTVGDKEIRVQINGAEFVVETQLTALPESTRPPVESLVVGGTGNLEPSGFPVDGWSNFRGCISNVQFRTRDKKVFRPLQDYDLRYDDTVSFQRQGLPNRTTCSRFRPKNLRAVVHNHAAYQARGRALSAPEEAPKRESFKALERTAEEESDGSTLNTVGKVAALFMGAVCVGGAVYLCKITHESKKRKEQQETGYGPVTTVIPELGAEEEQQVHICKKRLGSSTGSSSESDKSLLLDNAIEMIEDKRPASTEALAAPCDLQYVKETPEDAAKTSPDDEKDVQDQSTKDAEAEDHLQQEEVSKVTEQNVDQQQELSAPETIVDASPDQNQKSQTNEELGEETTDRSKDIRAQLGNNDLEKNYTKLSESQEDVAQTEDQENFSTSSDSGSTASDTADAAAVDLDEAGEPQKQTKKKHKKSVKRSGSYVLNDSDGEEPLTAEGVPKGGAAEDAPKAVSTSELKDLPTSEGVEEIDAQNYYLSRQPSSPPQMPPKQGTK